MRACVLSLPPLSPACVRSLSTSRLSYSITYTALAASPTRNNGVVSWLTILHSTCIHAATGEDVSQQCFGVRQAFLTSWSPHASGRLVCPRSTRNARPLNLNTKRARFDCPVAKRWPRTRQATPTASRWCNSSLRARGHARDQHGEIDVCRVATVGHPDAAPSHR